ncbi:hypothetical protein BGW42_007538 [Actinomortierella wolfii]|nr:hypothetical protein BGW42_007538 [Actinomortierella wolfii]
MSHRGLLPPEVIGAIVAQVHDLPTLFSLLTVNSTVFEFAVQRLYYDPFQLLALQTHHHGSRAYTHRCVEALRAMLLSLSPYEDDITVAILEAYDVAQDAPPSFGTSPSAANSIQIQPVNQSKDIGIRKFRTNYLRYIRSFEYSDYSVDSRWLYHMSGFLSLDNNNTLTEKLDPHWSTDRIQAYVHSSVTWACVGHQLSQIRAIQIPVHDIERYIQHVDEFACLEHAVFDLDILDTESWFYEIEYRPVMERCLEFIRLLVIRMTGLKDGSETMDVDHYHHHHNNMKQWQRPFSVSFCFYFSYGEKCELVREYTQQLYEIMPPLYKPTSLTPDNWERFLCKADMVDLTHVKHVRVGGQDYFRPMDSYSDHSVSSSWNDIEQRWGNVFGPRAAPRILQACRSLRSLETEIYFDGLFDWAVEERLKPMKPFTSPPQQIVQLSNVSLLCTPNVSLGVVNDTMTAFGTSIEKAKYQWMESTHSARNEDEYNGDNSINKTWDQEYPIILGGVDTLPWNLPRLTHLEIECNHDIRVHSTAFDNCPNLETLRLVERQPEPTRYSARSHKSLKRGINTTINQQLLDADNTPPQLPAWTNISKLQELILAGMICHSFHPHTLRFTELLTKLVIRCPTVQQANPSSSHGRTACGDTMADLWTWDWMLPSLRHLELDGPVVSTFEFVPALRCLPRLQAVCLTYQHNKRRPRRLLPVPQSECMNSMKAHTVQSHQSSQPIQHKHLRSISLRGAWLLTDSDIEQLVDRITPRLAHLALRKGCKGFTAKGFVEHTSKHQSTTFKLGECETYMIHRAAELEIGLERRPPNEFISMKSMWGRIPQNAEDIVLWDDDEDCDDGDQVDGGASQQKGTDHGHVTVPGPWDPVLLNFCVYVFGGTQFWLK